MDIQAEYLLRHSSSEQELLRLAALWGVPRGDANGRRLPQLIAEAYIAPNIVRRFAALPDVQQDLMHMLSVLSVAYREPMPMQTAAQKINQRLKAKGNGESMLRELAGTGLLFIVRDRWRESIAVPFEVWSALVARLAEQMEKRIRLQSRAEGEVQVIENAGLALYQDVLTIVAACVHELVEVSQKGQIYKRTMNRILPSLRSKEEWFPQHWQSELPRQFHFLVSFLENSSVLDADEYMAVNEHALEPFLAVNYIQWARMLHSYYLIYCFLQEGVPYSFMHSVMYRSGRDAWISVEAVMRELTQLLSEWQACPPREQLELICIRPFVALGLMKLGKDRNGELLFQWTEWGKEFILRNLIHAPDEASQLDRLLSTDLFVQPNLEIMVPENALPAIRWKVEALAQLKRADSVLIYELSKDRIVQALDAGWTMDHIRRFLDAHSKTPVTENVYRTIQGWIGNYGKAELWDVMVLRLGDPGIASLVERDKHISKLIVAKLSADCFVIQRASEKKVRGYLKENGFPVAYRIHNPDSRSLEDREEKRYSFAPYSRMDKEGKKALVYEGNLDSLAPDYCSFALSKEEVLSNVLAAHGHQEMDDEDDYEF